MQKNRIDNTVRIILYGILLIALLPDCLKQAWRGFDLISMLVRGMGGFVSILLLVYTQNRTQPLIRLIVYIVYFTHYYLIGFFIFIYSTIIIAYLNI